MSDNSSDSVAVPQPARNWWLRRLCSQNPFYLLSVCFVLHSIAHWFHADSGVAFSPWPLLWLTAGYTLLLALTGFVIIRFGKVWDDARSILLILLLLFVELSLIFDESLVRDPVAGRWLLFTGWSFSAVLSEFILLGLRIRLPLLYRIPYHGLLAVLFFYPFLLVSAGPRLPIETVLWRIFLFPSAASLVLLTLIPAIHCTSNYTRNNGTPWLWPWYPWSLFVFLGVCLGFRSYALCQFFDPVLGESTQSAMNFSCAFGVYFLVPLMLAGGLLLLEIGRAEKQEDAVGLAMFVPLLCLYLSIPSTQGSGPYVAFLNLLIHGAGSPVWLTLWAVIAFYALAAVRRIPAAEQCLAIALLVMSRVDQLTTNLWTLAEFHWMPLALLAAFELMLGLVRDNSKQVFVGCCSAIGAFACAGLNNALVPTPLQPALWVGLLVAAVLLVGAAFRDEFAWSLRVLGAPLLVGVTIAGFVWLKWSAIVVPDWYGPALVASTALIALTYSVLVGMPLYRLSSFLCAASGTAGLTEMAVMYLIRESGWRGAGSFVIGIGCLLLAACISSWKAGWLDHFPDWIRGMLLETRSA